MDGGSCLCGVESTVIALDDAETVRVLRPGFVTPEQLGTIAARVIVDDAVLAKVAEGTVVRSPGMKYRHYAPKARVTLVQGGREDFLRYMENRRRNGSLALVFDADVPACRQNGIPCKPYGDTDEARAAAFFAALREADAEGVQHLYVRAPRTDGVGLAVYNRLIRAAGYDIVHAESI